jgi:uncharacterized protein YmfQ (DUF2313 family)
MTRPHRTADPELDAQAHEDEHMVDSLIDPTAQDMLDELLARDHDLKMRDWEFLTAIDDKLKHGHSVNDAAARRIVEIHGRVFGQRSVES